MVEQTGGPRVLVINLKSRPDRRQWMSKSCVLALSEAGADAGFVWESSGLSLGGGGRELMRVDHAGVGEWLKAC